MTDRAMAPVSDLARQLAPLDAIAQSELVRRGELTALEVVDAAVERVERANPIVNAIVTPLFDAARGAARALATHGLPAGPLAGAPFAVKDLGAPMTGVRQTAGSLALRDHVPGYDAEIVRRYRAAGLAIVGRTSTPELGNMSTTEPVLFGPTRNPWDLERTAGGSSGGSAAAVASGMVPFAHASDGAGSIRIPASCCGLFGMKTTRGRTSAAPGGEPLAGLAVTNSVTRSVRDSAALLDATCGRVAGDHGAAPPRERPFLEEVGREPGRLRIGWTATPPVPAPVDAACVDAVRETAALLADLGHDVDEAAPPIAGDVIVERMGRVWAISNAQDAREMERILGRPLRDDELEETTWEMVRYGRRWSAVDLLDDLDALEAEARRVAPFFETHDAWLTPTLAREPERLGVLTRLVGPDLAWWRFDCEFNPFNPIANILGHPAMSVPLHWAASGLPIGVLFTGRFGDEAGLYRLAGQLEAARPWAERRPPTWAGA